MTIIEFLNQDKNLLEQILDNEITKRNLTKASQIQAQIGYINYILEEIEGGKIEDHSSGINTKSNS